MRRTAVLVGASVGVPVGTIFVWARLVMRRARLRTSEGAPEMWAKLSEFERRELSAHVARIDRLRAEAELRESGEA